MKNKQEVIEVILGELDYQEMVPTDVRLNNRALAERIEILLRLRIAPLIRGEFPEEEYNKVITAAWIRGRNYEASEKDSFWENIKHLKGEAKRLWEDQEIREDKYYNWEKHVLDCIAPPVVREFPDEALKDLLVDWPELWEPEILHWKIKCLIEGQDHIAEVRKKVEQDKPKGTGEEKKKYCLRCGVVCSENSVVSCHRNAGEKIGKHRWTNERSGEERRKGTDIRCTAIPVFGTNQILPFGGYVNSRAVLPAGWHEDHRILPERRKAGAG